MFYFQPDAHPLWAYIRLNIAAFFNLCSNYKSIAVEHKSGFFWTQTEGFWTETERCFVLQLFPWQCHSTQILHWLPDLSSAIRAALIRNPTADQKWSSFSKERQSSNRSSAPMGRTYRTKMWTHHLPLCLALKQNYSTLSHTVLLYSGTGVVGAQQFDTANLNCFQGWMHNRLPV